MKYLHADAQGIYHLDHRLTAEVRAMLCAMASRMPAGGIAARYSEIVEAVAESLWDTARVEAAAGDGYENKKRLPSWEDAKDLPMYSTDSTLSQAEERLTVYPLHPKVQVFFDKFVKMYGHSSIMELTGSPSVYMEGISWYDAWLTFDNPLVAGQEFSTRAVRHKDWPMARSCYEVVESGDFVYSIGQDTPVGRTHESRRPHPSLKELHDGWFEVFEAEVDWWANHLKDAANREALGIADKEPFRPALDRARWAIPGTIATGCAHTANLRTMARVIQIGSLLAQRGKAQSSIDTWNDIRKGYEAAVPGLAEMGLREAVYNESTRIPAHNLVNAVAPNEEVIVRGPVEWGDPHGHVQARPEGEPAYVDPAFNQIAQIEIAFQCSLAVARDWHRHRTMFPWFLDVVRRYDGTLGDIEIHPAYEAKSDLAREKVPGLLRQSTAVFDSFIGEENQMQAMLALPLGTRVRMRGTGGLRNVIYMLELRGHAHGANFEYKAQALEAIRQLRGMMPDNIRSLVGI
jgi:hypothetical protein